MEPKGLDQLTEDLEARGYAVVEGFVDPVTCRALAAEMTALQEAGGFRAAGVGRGTNHQVRTEIRGDSVRWLESGTLTPLQAAVWERLEMKRQALNRRLFLGLSWFEGHLAIYPEGAAYVKHVDTFKDDSARTVSYVLYLNQDWREADGGQLRLYARAAPDRVERDVLPEAGTLVCFLSAETPHEVLPPARPRYSFTGWFRTDTPR
jgi:SM-20-related protein